MFPVTVKDADGSFGAVGDRGSRPATCGSSSTACSRATASRTSPWSGRIDPAHIGAAGMSLGGLAVYAATTESCCTDRRIDAAVLMAAVYRDVPDSEQHPNRIPMMLLQGDVDPGYHNSRDAYSDLRAPKWFVTLHGSRHAPPFEVPRGPEAAVVDAATVAFWDLAAARRPHRPCAHRRRGPRPTGRTTSLQADPGARRPGDPAPTRRGDEADCGKMAAWPSRRAALDPRPRDRRARRHATRRARRQRRRSPSAPRHAATGGSGTPSTTTWRRSRRRPRAC